ncbi:MAG: hypothetical protein HYS86_00195 [Candidatus Chisholmbacteria bacterium]|nr:hypothetical protein [Candidatus Chisholmbacteria bacterium]
MKPIIVILPSHSDFKTKVNCEIRVIFRQREGHEVHVFLSTFFDWATYLEWRVQVVPLLVHRLEPVRHQPVLLERGLGLVVDYLAQE